MKKETPSLREKRSNSSEKASSLREKRSNPIKTLILIFIALGICGFIFRGWIAAPSARNDNTETKPTIKIGATFPLTGDGAEAGQSAKAGMEMMLEDLQKKNLKYNYELIFEDNQMVPVKTATTANKLINVDEVKVIFAHWGLMANVAADIADKKGIVGMFVSYGENATKGDYNFNFMPSYEQQAQKMVEELKKRNVKSVALFIDNSDIRNQFDALINEINNNSDIKVAFKEYFNVGEKDYRMSIAKAKESNPDMYIISGYPPSPLIFIKQLKEITGRNDNVTSIDSIAEMNLSDLYIANNLWYIDTNQQGLKQFQDELLERKGIEAGSCSGHVTSNLQVIVAAFENAKIEEGEVFPSNEAIKNWIFDNVKGFDTISGKATVINNGLITVPVSVKKIIDGKSVFLN